MLKKNPFLKAAIVFGALSLILLVIAAVSVVNNDSTVSKAIAGLFKFNTDSFNNATIGQLALVFAIPSFIFAFRSLDS